MAGGDNHTRFNAEVPCFTPSTDAICVLSHSTPGIDQNMSTDVISVDKASQYCTQKTVSTSIQTLPMTKTRKVQTDTLHSVGRKVHRVDSGAQCDEQCSTASQTDEIAATHVTALTNPPLSLCDKETITYRPCGKHVQTETHGKSKGVMATDVHNKEIKTLTKDI